MAKTKAVAAVQAQPRKPHERTLRLFWDEEYIIMGDEATLVHDALVRGLELAAEISRLTDSHAYLSSLGHLRPPPHKDLAPFPDDCRWGRTVTHATRSLTQALEAISGMWTMEDVLAERTQEEAQVAQEKAEAPA